MTEETREPTIGELLARIEELEATAKPRSFLRRVLGGRVPAIAVTVLLAGSVAMVPSFAGAAEPFWSLGGTTGSNPSTNYIGTSDNAGLSIRTNGTQAIGVDTNQNVTVKGSLNAQGGVQENGTPLSSRYATVDGANATGTWPIGISGNAGSVTNGVYTTGDQTIGGAKTFSSTIQGDVSGNAGTVTNGLYSTGSYSDPGWLTSLSGDKVTGSVARATAADSAANFTGTLVGDVTGLQGSTKVTGLQGVGLSSTAPSGGDVLQYDAGNKAWTPAALPTASLPNIVVESRNTTVLGDHDLYSDEGCPSGYTAIDGGYQLASDQMHMVQSYPEESPGGVVAGDSGNNAWHYEVYNSTPSKQGVSVFVTCLKTS